MEENNIIVRNIFGGGTTAIKKECNIRNRLPSKNCLECRYYRKINQNSYICEYFTETVPTRFDRSFSIGFVCGLVFAIVVCVALLISGCGESPDSFSLRGTDEDTDTETDSHSNTERESTEIYESDSTTGISSDIDEETNMDTLEDTDVDTDTDMVSETDNDICTDTDMDVETDTFMEGNTDADNNTDTDMDEDTDADTDTDDIHDPICQLDDPVQDDFVCQDQPDDYVSNNCPYDMNNQHYGSCCTETLWVCPLADNVEYFGYNNYQTEWTICDDQDGTPVCPEFYICVQVGNFGRKCI